MNSNNIHIRKGKKEDLPSVLEHIKELALFEKAPEQVTNTVEAMEEDAFGKNPCFDFFVAEVENKIVGIAVYFVKYSTWKGRGLYLDDLVVTQKYRSKGIGRSLLNYLAKLAQKRKCGRLEWAVLNWNEPAINFYKKFRGVEFDEEWVNCCLHI